MKDSSGWECGWVGGIAIISSFNGACKNETERENRERKEREKREFIIITCKNVLFSALKLHHKT